MVSLCHPWFTTTNLSYRFPIFETSATALCGTTGIIYFIYNDSWDAHPGRVPARQDMSWEWAAEAPSKSLFVFSSMLCSFPGGISCLWGISPSNLPGTQAWIDVDPVCLLLVFSRVRMHTRDWMLDPPALLVENTAGAPRRNQQRGEGAARLGPWVSVSKVGDTWMRKIFQLGKEWQVNNHWILYVNILYIYIYIYHSSRIASGGFRIVITPNDFPCWSSCCHGGEVMLHVYKCIHSTPQRDRTSVSRMF